MSRAAYLYSRYFCRFSFLTCFCRPPPFFSLEPLRRCPVVRPGDFTAICLNTFCVPADTDSGTSGAEGSSGNSVTASTVEAAAVTVDVASEMTTGASGAGEFARRMDCAAALFSCERRARRSRSVSSGSDGSADAGVAVGVVDSTWTVPVALSLSAFCASAAFLRSSFWP